MTEEEKKAKRAESAKAVANRKKSAKEAVKVWLESKPRLDEEVKKNIEYLVGLNKKMRSGATNELRELILAQKSVSLMDIFQKFEYGRPTMEQKIRQFIKVSDPASRIWVAFEDGNYVLKGQGANPPKGWNGYTLPASEEL